MGTFTASTPDANRQEETRREMDHNGGFMGLSNFLENFLCDK